MKLRLGAATIALQVLLTTNGVSAQQIAVPPIELGVQVVQIAALTEGLQHVRRWAPALHSTSPSETHSN